MSIRRVICWFVVGSTLTACSVGNDPGLSVHPEAGADCDAGTNCASDGSSGSGGLAGGGGQGGRVGGNGGSSGSTGGAAPLMTGGASGSGATGSGGEGGTDGGSDSGAGGAPSTDGIGTVGERCSPEGAFACEGHAVSGQLTCQMGKWIKSGPGCATGTLCDTGAANVGKCVVVVPECVGKSAGTKFCRNLESLECGADLVSAKSLETCDFLCTAGSCAGECTPMMKDCGGGGDAGSGKIPRECQAGGTWLESAPCAFVCAAGKCVAATCGDNVVNGTESDVDCGGNCGQNCTVNEKCNSNTDCVLPASGKCTNAKCVAPACNDTVKNGSETDVDCGGSCGAKCAVSKKCGGDGDCASGVCLSGTCAVCRPASKQCSGTGVQTCANDGSGWGGAVACSVTNGTPSCSAGVCGAASCNSGFLNCDANALTCEAPSNTVASCGTTCANRAACSTANGTPACTGGACAISSCSAGFCNMDGSVPTGCEAKLGTGAACGTSCATATVCSPSQVCNGTACVSPTSCAGLASNCGASGNESCCTSPTVPGGNNLRLYDTAPGGGFPTTISSFRLDKYDVTVGRFRKYVAAFQPNISAGAGKNPNNPSDPGWDAAWKTSLPANGAALASDLACDATATWTTNVGANETMPITCVTWYVAAAFCIYDGGRLPTEAEWNYAASGGNEQRWYPWSNPSQSMTIDCSYADAKLASGGTACVSPPDGAPIAVGSKPAGNGKWGQSDLVGNVDQWILDWYVEPYPATCTNCAVTSGGTERDLRGGDFGSPADSLQVRGRASVTPAGRAGFIGFRCARAL